MVETVGGTCGGMGAVEGWVREGGAMVEGEMGVAVGAGVGVVDRVRVAGVMGVERVVVRD